MVWITERNVVPASRGYFTKANQPGVVVLTKQDVFGVKITVNNAATVRVVQCLGSSGDDPKQRRAKSNQHGILHRQTGIQKAEETCWRA